MTILNKNSFNKKVIIIPTALIVISIGLFYLWRDLHLENIKKMQIPDIVVENIQIEREVNGKLWKLIAPLVEHKNGIIYGQSLDVTIQEDSSKISSVFAQKGMFTRDNNNIELLNAKAEMNNGNKKYTFHSDQAKYTAKSDTWYFSDNVLFTNGTHTVKSKNATYNTKTGECIISDGGKITWDKH